MSVHLTEAEIVGLRRIAASQDGQPVRIHRDSGTDSILDVTVPVTVAGEHLLFVLSGGEVYRVADEMECAARAIDLVHMNLLPVTDEELAPLDQEVVR